MNMIDRARGLQPTNAGHQEMPSMQDNTIHADIDQELSQIQICVIEQV